MTVPDPVTKLAMKPTRAVLFWRTFLPFQLYRFLWINWRMIRMIWLSHRSP